MRKVKCGCGREVIIPDEGDPPNDKPPSEKCCIKTLVRELLSEMKSPTGKGVKVTFFDENNNNSNN